jgi:hypothetical protein
MSLSGRFWHEYQGDQRRFSKVVGHRCTRTTPRLHHNRIADESRLALPQISNLRRSSTQAIQTSEEATRFLRTFWVGGDRHHRRLSLSRS